MNKTKRKAAKRALLMRGKPDNYRGSILQSNFIDDVPYKPKKARPSYFLNEYGFEQPLPQKDEGLSF
jgi:hypothetical protein